MGRVCKRIDEILTKREIERLEVLIEMERKKEKNKNNIYLLEKNIKNVKSIEYYMSYIYSIKNYRSKEDTEIRNKLKNELNNWSFNKGEVLNKVKPRKYKFGKKDWEIYINRSEEYFKRYKSISEEFFSGFKDCLSRAYLGFGFEFLLKGIFLKEGYAINKLESNYFKKNKNIQKPLEPIRISQLNKKNMSEQIHEFGYFIDILPKILPKKYREFRDKRYRDYYLITGLKIAQIWRNLDIHGISGNKMIDGEMEQLLNYSHSSLYKIFLKERVKPKVKF